MFKMYFRDTHVVKMFVFTVLFIVLSFVFVFPVASHGIILSSDDAPYHIARINEIYENFKEGNFFPVLSTHTFAKIGYPVNLFYPWFTLIPFALLRFIVSPVAAIYLGIAFYTWLTFLVTFFVGKRMTSSDKKALLFSILYVFATYRTIDIYTRFALGEFLATVFLPISLYGFYEVMFGNRKNWPFLTLGMTLLIFSHVLSTFIVTLFFALVFLCSFWNINGKISRLLSMIKAVIATVLCSAAYLIPFLEQELMQKFPQPSKMPFSPGAFSKILMSSLDNNVLRNVNFSNYYGIGFVCVAICVFGVMNLKKMNKLNYILFWIGILIFFMASSLFPWSLFDNTPINVIQFPFRILSIGTLLLSFVGANLIIDTIEDSAHINHHSGMQIVILIGLVVVPWYSSVVALVNSPDSNQSEYTFDSKNINRETNISGYYLDQYTPRKAIKNLNNIINGNGYINGKIVHFARNTDQSSIKFHLKHRISSNAVIELPFAYYDNVVVMVGKNRMKIDESSNGLIQLKTGKHNSDTYTVKYSMSKMDMISILVTLASILGLIWICFFRKDFRSKKSFSNFVNIHDDDKI